MKRTFAALTGALLLSACTVTACAEEFSESMEWMYTVNTDGQTATITIGSMAVSQNSGKVEIPMEIDGYTVTGIGPKSFSQETGLFTVFIPYTVMSVGDYAFQDCYGLNTVTMENGAQFIGNYAFSNCYGLYNAVLSDELVSIGDGAFENCTALTEIYIPDGVTEIGDRAFEKCTALQTVFIPESVTVLGDDVFEGCTSMLTVYYEGSGVEWDKIEKDENDFWNIPVIFASGEADYTTEPTEEIPVELPDYEPYAEYNGFTYKIRSDDTVVINGYHDSVYDMVVIPSEIEGRPVIRIGNGFSPDQAEAIVVPEGVKEIGEQAFSWSFALREIYLPKSLEIIEENAFSFCFALETVYYSGSEEEWNRIEFGDGNEQLKNKHIIFNYKEGEYEKAASVTAIILCSVCVLILAAVIIIVATRKKPVCPECGAQLDDDSKFCGACGIEL